MVYTEKEHINYSRYERTRKRGRERKEDRVPLPVT